MSEHVTVAIERYTKSLAFKHEKNGRNSYAENTRLVLLKLIRGLGIEYLDELTPEKVRAYVGGNSILSKKTLKNHVAALSAFMSWGRNFSIRDASVPKALDIFELEHQRDEARLRVVALEKAILPFVLYVKEAKLHLRDDVATKVLTDGGASLTVGAFKYAVAVYCHEA